MEIVSSEFAPAAIGPYSQAVKASGFLFVSGQIALDLNGNLNDGDISVQTEIVMANLEAILKEAGLSFLNVVKTTVYLKNISDFSVFNEVYSKYFISDFKPARSTVEVSNLPKGAKIEIDCLAAL